MKKKYICIPGFGKSKPNGAVNWISEIQLMKLYNVNRDEVLVLPYNYTGMDYPDDLIQLTVREDDNYKLKEQ